MKLLLNTGPIGSPALMTCRLGPVIKSGHSSRQTGKPHRASCICLGDTVMRWLGARALDSKSVGISAFPSEKCVSKEYLTSEGGCGDPVKSYMGYILHAAVTRTCSTNVNLICGARCEELEYSDFLWTHSLSPLSKITKRGRKGVEKEKNGNKKCWFFWLNQFGIGSGVLELASV